MNRCCVLHNWVNQIVGSWITGHIKRAFPIAHTQKSCSWRCHGCVPLLFLFMVFEFCNMMSTVVLNFNL
ncbi:unnamed protein product, partial [Vitis vinifera]